MTDAADLHARLESLERRIAAERDRIADLDENRRRGLGALLEALSARMDAHDRERNGSR